MPTTTTPLPYYYPSAFSDVRDSDRKLFQTHLAAFVPPNSFDVHAHLYTIPGLRIDTNEAPEEAEARLGLSQFHTGLQSWMGELAPQDGLFFALPSNHDVDVDMENAFVAAQASRSPGSRALMLVRPHDDPQTVEQTILRDGFVGLKVYHLLADGPDTFNLPAEAFLTDWMWEIADRHSLAIMLHMVRPTALADPSNQRYIRQYCTRYPSAKLILAHAARGFCSHHTVDAIRTLSGLHNVYFDTSAVCESGALQAIIQATGTTRLMFGTDWPISDLRGRCTNLGYGFFWLYPSHVDFSAGAFSSPTLVGIESLLAIKEAAQLCHLNDSDVQRIFCDNARLLLEISSHQTQDETQSLYNQAKQLIPGGTQLLSKRPEMFAPNQWPAYYREAHGCEVVDIHGRSFTDMTMMGVGSCLLGYNDPDVTAAVQRRVMLGSMATLNSPEEVELAEALVKQHPWAHKVRYARTGGEAMAVAVRIARAQTGRDGVAVCGYHGWHDWYLAANLPTTNETQDSLAAHLLPGLSPAGLPNGLKGTTRTFSYNNLDQFEALIADAGASLAAIVMEPTRNVDPSPGFLEAIRETCRKRKIVLIFDEITAGWRLALGGAHLKYGVMPDIAVFAKALGNGHPMAAIIGTSEVMQAAQQSFISSTYWTESVGPAAAVATLRKLEAINLPAHLQAIGGQFQRGMQRIAQQHRLPLRVMGHAPLTSMVFDDPQNLAMQTFYTQRLLNRGWLAGSAFYPSYAHQHDHVDAFLQAADEVMQELAEARNQNRVIDAIGGEQSIRHAGFARLT